MTGAGGFLGQALCLKLQGLGLNVYGTTRLKLKKGCLYKNFVLDIRDKKNVLHIIKKLILIMLSILQVQNVD